MKLTVRFHEHTIASIQRIVAEFGAFGTVIEIGCFQGDTTFNLAGRMIQLRPGYKHYAIDPYGVSADLPDSDIIEAKQLFLENLQEFESQHPGVVQFINKPSWSGMMDLWHQGVQADFIYIDGDHRAAGVLEDMVLAWRLLRPGGIMLCDDAHVWRADGSVTNSPRMAVDTFIHCNWDHLNIVELPSGYQVALRKKL